MTILGIRYLTGNSVASQTANPRSPEWPPHPGRVYLALAAAHFETRGGIEEREALEWLGRAGSPKLSAPKPQFRSFAETYVPANDNHRGISRRPRQPRTFPTVRPESDSVYFGWEESLPENLRRHLDELCAKVTRLGHSSSLVQMWLPDQPTPAEWNWIPDQGSGDQQMRVAEEGTLTYLRNSFNEAAIAGYVQLDEAIKAARGKEQRRLKEELFQRFPDGKPVSTRPVLTNWQAYRKVSAREPTAPVIAGPFDPEILIFSPQQQPGSNQDVSSRLGLAATLQLTSALRDAAMKAADPAPEWLSGHRPDGAPSTNPHVAFFPLPFVDSVHADGHLLGVAMAIPHIPVAGADPAAPLRHTLGPLLFDEDGTERTIRLWRGNAWKWHVQREKRDYPPFTLRAGTWTNSSFEWASVTPVVLHHYPKPNRADDVERIVLEAFESAGFPKPVDLRVQSVSHFTGAGHARSLPPFTEGGGSLCRYQTHVLARFAAPVQGPVLVGRGRFRGYGLFRPVRRAV